MSDNPYQPPSVTVTDPVNEDNAQLVEPKKLPAGNGWGWIAKGFGYFKSSPAIWIVNILILVVIFMVLAFIPLLGSIATSILAPIFTGGLMLGCAAQNRGEQLAVSHLFEGFQKNTGSLAIVGVLYLVGMIVLMLLVGIIIAVVGGGSDIMATMSNPATDPADIPDNFMSILLITILLGVALSIPLVMAYFFAPALVVFHDLGAIDAMKLSFRGCLRNIVPFLVYGVVAIILAIVATIPFGLGWLVLAPVLTAAIYAAYREIFTE